MELLINLERFEHKINGEGLSSSDIEEIKKELEFDGDQEISERNIGPGADVMVILVSILTIANIFLLGDKIDKGIEGWIKIGKRLKKLFSRKELVALDKDGASLLAIEFIYTIETIISIEKEAEHEISLVRQDGLFGDGRKPEELISKPYNYYIQTFLVNDEKHYIIGIKSTGEVNLIKCFEFGNPYGISEIKTTPQ